MGSSCFARGNEKNLQIIEEYLCAKRLEANVELSGSRCEGICSEGPNLSINGKMHSMVDSGVLIDLLDQLFQT